VVAAQHLFGHGFEGRVADKVEEGRVRRAELVGIVCGLECIEVRPTQPGLHGGAAIALKLRHLQRAQ
jgi:hypothetical protein